MRMLRIITRHCLALMALGVLLAGPVATVPAADDSASPSAVAVMPEPPSKAEPDAVNKAAPAKVEVKDDKGKATPPQKSTSVDAPVVEGDSTAVLPEPDADHKIAPTETIRIDVYEEKDMTAPELRVQAGGKVKYFLIGDVEVGGKTAIEAADLIRRMLIEKEFYVDPQVIVTVVQYRKQYVFVQGDVVRPGAVPLEGEIKMTISDAIGQAQGPTRAANTKKIQFIRNGKIQVFDLEKLNKEKDPQKRIYVEDRDTIFVPQSLF